MDNEIRKADSVILSIHNEEWTKEQSMEDESYKLLDDKSLKNIRHILSIGRRIEVKKP